MKIKKISGSVTAPKGFLAAGIRAGIKKTKKLDLALIVSEKPCRAAGVFTSNRVKAPPVLFNLRQVKLQPIHGVLTNSGNANACTGQKGYANAVQMAQLASKAFEERFRFGRMDPKKNGAKFLVCSTGRIGVQLPMQKIAAAVPELVGALRRKGDDHAALAMMTSDTFPKKIAVQFKLGGRRVRIGGVCKGAGMIHPRMNEKGLPLHATMLCTLATDACISRSSLQKSLNVAVEQSFNSISVDGDTSTNDTVILLANGEAANNPPEYGSPGHGIFQQALNQVTLELAKMIVRDGEGVSRFITVKIQGCRSASDAEKAGRAVINSMLVKSAWSGGDPNWGRIMDAVGYSGAFLKENRMRIWYGGHLLVKNGRQNDSEVPAVQRVVKKAFFQVTIDFVSGKYCRTFYTTDLTEKYVTLNKTE